MEPNEDYTLRDSERGQSPQSDAWEGSGNGARQELVFGSRTVPPQQHGTEILKVSTRSRPSAVAGAIAGVIRESGMAEVQSIGAGATNQAIKAVAIARSYLQEEGIHIYCIPSFIDVAIDAEERTAIRLLIQKQPAS